MSFSLSMMDDKEGGGFVFDWLPYKEKLPLCSHSSDNCHL